jgi:hypothetical protein
MQQSCYVPLCNREVITVPSDYDAVKQAPRQRVPNGVASRRVMVAMPDALLKRVEERAAAEMRSSSAMINKLVGDQLGFLDEPKRPLLRAVER